MNHTAILPVHKSNLPLLVRPFREFFDSIDVDAFLVGGAIRDTLIGHPVSDIDLAIDGDAGFSAERLASKLGGHTITLDKSRGVFRVTLRNCSECPIQNIDLKSMGKSNITSDLSQRDFTIDAMAIALDDTDLQIIDPFGGMVDLGGGIIRFVKPLIFDDDPIRLIRGPRIASQLDFKIAVGTADQIKKKSCLIQMASPDQVREEFMAIIGVHRASSWLRLLDGLGLLCSIIPEMQLSKGVSQPKEHYWDVFNHAIETVDKAEFVVRTGLHTDDAIAKYLPRFDGKHDYFNETISNNHTRLTLLKMASLLHDIAKPTTKTIEQSGRIRFLGHHTKGAEIAKEIATRLNLGKKGIELIKQMVSNHLRPSQMATKGELPSGKAIYRYFKDVGDASIDTLYLNLADFLAAKGPLMETTSWSHHCRVIGHVVTQGLTAKAPEKLPYLVNGHDIIELFHIKPGRQVGSLLALVKEAQANGEISTMEEALNLVKTKLDQALRNA